MAIKIKKSHRGLLHKKLGISAHKMIPLKTLSRAKHGASGALKKEIVFAENARKWHHK